MIEGYYFPLNDMFNISTPLLALYLLGLKLDLRYAPSFLSMKDDQIFLTSFSTVESFSRNSSCWSKSLSNDWRVELCSSFSLTSE